MPTFDLSPALVVTAHLPAWLSTSLPGRPRTGSGSRFERVRLSSSRM